jgi:hypothetical protein
VNNYEIALDRKEVTGSFTMNFDRKSYEFFGFTKVPWYRWIPRWIMYWLYPFKQFAYPPKVVPQIPLQRDLKFYAADQEYNLPGMFIDRVSISMDRNGFEEMHVNFTSRRPGDLTGEV